MDEVQLSQGDIGKKQAKNNILISFFNKVLLLFVENSRNFLRKLLKSEVGIFVL